MKFGRLKFWYKRDERFSIEDKLLIIKIETAGYEGIVISSFIERRLKGMKLKERIDHELCRCFEIDSISEHEMKDILLTVRNSFDEYSDNWFHLDILINAVVNCYFNDEEMIDLDNFIKERYIDDLMDLDHELFCEEVAKAYNSDRERIEDLSFIGIRSEIKATFKPVMERIKPPHYTPEESFRYSVLKDYISYILEKADDIGFIKGYCRVDENYVVYSVNNALQSIRATHKYEEDIKNHLKPWKNREDACNYKGPGNELYEKFQKIISISVYSENDLLLFDLDDNYFKYMESVIEQEEKQEEEMER